MSFYTTENIPYQEYRAINDLVQAQLGSQNGRIRAVIVFGALVTGADVQDINILEVVDGWKGPRHARFGSTVALPLRGQLNLYVLTPDEFENPSARSIPDEHWSSADLLTRVLKSYAILLEHPNDYAFRRLSRLEDVPSFEESPSTGEDPITFLNDSGLHRA